MVPGGGAMGISSAWAVRRVGARVIALARHNFNTWTLLELQLTTVKK